MRRLMLDVESAGLHGEAFAYGYVILDGPMAIEEGLAIANPDACSVDRDDFEWLSKNVFPWIRAMSVEFPKPGERPIVQPDPTTGVAVVLCDGPASLRDVFWATWEHHKARGVELWADVCWPVEANFLSACVRAKTGRKFEGPYPLMDVATLWQFDHRDSLPRIAAELPEHHPLMDARHSARKLRIVLERADPA